MVSRNQLLGDAATPESQEVSAAEAVYHVVFELTCQSEMEWKQLLRCPYIQARIAPCIISRVEECILLAKVSTYFL